LGDARLDLGHTCIGNSRPVSKKKRPLANGFREPSREVKVSHDRAEDPQPRDPSDYRTRGCLRIGNAHEATLELSLSAERNEAKQLGSAVSIPYASAYTTQAVLQDKRNSHTLHVETSSYEDRDSYAAIAAGFHKPKPKREAGKRLSCEYANCTYEGTFPRQWELQRHIAAKHITYKPYWCPMVGCVKVGGPARFARPDKLAAHVRAVHYSKGTKVVCPDASCAA
jgi:hypothetical protein